MKLTQFAYDALVSARQRFELILRGCGEGLALVSSQGVVGTVGVVDEVVSTQSWTRLSVTYA